MEKKTMTVKELSCALGVSKPTAYELIKKDGFPVIQIGRRKLILIDGFNRWLETGGGAANGEMDADT